MSKAEEGEKKEIPSRDQMIQWYRDEIELATLRAELAQLQRDATVAEAERIQAIGVIAQMTQSVQGDDKPVRKLKREDGDKEGQ